MNSQRRVAILTGGDSGEREIALASAGNVAKVLTDHYLVTTFDLPKQLDTFLSQRKEFEVVIPIFHGRGGEDGTVQGFLETLRIPYLFSGVTAHAIGIDKNLAKGVISSAGIKTSPWSVLTKDDKLQSPPHIPCVVKPIDGGSTQGVTIVLVPDDFERAINEALKHSTRVLVENFISGDEFTVAVIDEGTETVAMPVIQIKSPEGFYDFAAKYGPQPAKKLCPAPISAALSNQLQEAAVKVHQAIGARHLTRTDFIVDHEGTIWFLEVNTIPGLSVLFPRAISASNRNFTEVLSHWIEEIVNNHRYQD